MDSIIFAKALTDIDIAIEEMRRDEKNYPQGSPERGNWVERYNALSNASRVLHRGELRLQKRVVDM